MPFFSLYWSVASWCLQSQTQNLSINVVLNRIFLNPIIIFGFFACPGNLWIWFECLDSCYFETKTRSWVTWVGLKSCTATSAWTIQDKLQSSHLSFFFFFWSISLVLEKLFPTGRILFHLNCMEAINLCSHQHFSESRNFEISSWHFCHF